MTSMLALSMVSICFDVLSLGHSCTHFNCFISFTIKTNDYFMGSLNVTKTI